MREELDKQLCEKYPLLFKNRNAPMTETCMCWGFEHGDGYSALIEGPNHTRVYDWEGRKAYQERISNGFRLFGKYYENLWD